MLRGPILGKWPLFSRNWVFLTSQNIATWQNYIRPSTRSTTPMVGKYSSQTPHHPWSTNFEPNLVLSVPIIIDPNNSDLTLWESGAIVQYLIEKYDTKHKISFASPPETYYASQWLHFQTSGQGPYFGQATWFVHLHHEKLPSAKERYLKEILRVTKVLDSELKGKDWLVGGKCTFADLAFVPWYGMVSFINQEGTLDLDKDCPNYAKWMKALLERPAVKKVMADKQAAMSAGK